MVGDAILIVFISFGTALFGEGLSWLFIYRTETYKKLKAEIDRQSRRLEKQKDLQDATTVDKQAKKKLERNEERLKTHNRDLSMAKMKSMVAITAVFMMLLNVFSSVFEGRVVAKLPFEPFSLIQGISHRGLPGTDFTDCSFIFLYIVCTTSVRQNIQKLLGFAPSRAANRLAGGSSFFPDQSQWNKQWNR